MPHYRRAYIYGGTYFFTVVTERRQKILTNDDMRRALRMAIHEVRLTLPFDIKGWVLLPDHLHCIWTLPAGDADYSTRWRKIKGKVTEVCGTRYFRGDLQGDRRAAKGQGTIWQQRFWEHFLRDAADLQAHLDYLHWNPVKHGLVQRVVDWPWSSFHRYVAEGAYTKDWGGSLGQDMAHLVGDR